VPDTIGLLARALEQMTRVLERLPPDSLDALTPCEGWTVRDLLRHVVRQNLRNFTAAARGETTDWSTPAPDLGGEWVATYREGARELLRTWKNADLDREVAMPGGASTPLRTRADQQIAELSVHAWDLTKAGRLDLELDRAVAKHALAWSQQMLQSQFRGPGKPFAEEVPVPVGAAAYDRLVGWFGRDPRWEPPFAGARGVISPGSARP